MPGESESLNPKSEARNPKILISNVLNPKGSVDRLRVAGYELSVAGSLSLVA